MYYFFKTRKFLPTKISQVSIIQRFHLYIVMFSSSSSFFFCRRKPPKMDDEDKENPSQGLMKLMQQMYDDGDDEMKRTIAKSWYESQEKRKKDPTGMGMDV